MFNDDLIGSRSCSFLRRAYAPIGDLVNFDEVKHAGEKHCLVFESYEATGAEEKGAYISTPLHKFWHRGQKLTYQLYDYYQ